MQPFPGPYSVFPSLPGIKDGSKKIVVWAERLVALWGNSYGTLYALGQAHAVAGQ